MPLDHTRADQIINKSLYGHIPYVEPGSSKKLAKKYLQDVNKETVKDPYYGFELSSELLENEEEDGPNLVISEYVDCTHKFFLHQYTFGPQADAHWTVTQEARNGKDPLVPFIWFDGNVVHESWAPILELPNRDIIIAMVFGLQELLNEDRGLVKVPEGYHIPLEAIEHVIKLWWNVEARMKRG